MKMLKGMSNEEIYADRVAMNGMIESAYSDIMDERLDKAIKRTQESFRNLSEGLKCVAEGVKQSVKLFKEISSHLPTQPIK